LKWAYVFHILVLKKYLKLNQYCSIKFWIVWISIQNLFWIEIWIVWISIQNSELKFG
jgi:hypothetical protein